MDLDMTDEPALEGMLLKDGEYSVHLHAPIFDATASWFDHPITLSAGPFTGSIVSTSYEGVEVLGAFLTELQALHQNMTGKAVLGERYYHNFILELEGDGSGRIAGKVDCIDGAYNGRLSFKLSLDQSYLPAAISAVKKFVRDGYDLRKAAGGPAYER